MKTTKATLCVAVLTITLSSNALAGTIVGARSSRTGTIVGARAGTIVGARSGNIAGARTGNIAEVRRDFRFVLSENLGGILRLFLESSLF